MTLPMPSSGTCRQVREGARAALISSLAGTTTHPPTLLGLSVPPGAPSPAHVAHQSVVKVKGADVVGRDVGRSQGTCDLGHNPTFI